MKPAACLLDEIASRLAAQGGHVWTQLGEHPGYRRNCYREQARAMMAVLGMPGGDRSASVRGA